MSRSETCFELTAKPKASGTSVGVALSSSTRRSDRSLQETIADAVQEVLALTGPALRPTAATFSTFLPRLARVLDARSSGMALAVLRAEWAIELAPDLYISSNGDAGSPAGDGKEQAQWIP
jgi:hypothetical protein